MLSSAFEPTAPGIDEPGDLPFPVNSEVAERRRRHCTLQDLPSVLLLLVVPSVPTDVSVLCTVQLATYDVVDSMACCDARGDEVVYNRIPLGASSCSVLFAFNTLLLPLPTYPNQTNLTTMSDAVSSLFSTHPTRLCREASARAL